MIIALAFVICTATTGQEALPTCSPMVEDFYRYSSFDECLHAAITRLPEVVNGMNAASRPEMPPYTAGGVFCVADTKQTEEFSQ